MSSDKIKSILIELNENYLEQYNEVISIMNKFDFKLNIKHAKMYDNNKKFSSVYNYIFENMNLKIIDNFLNESDLNYLSV